MRENHQLQDRVEMLGQVQHTNVRNVLVRGHIYLNCSLTEVRTGGVMCVGVCVVISCGAISCVHHAPRGMCCMRM